MNQRLNEAIRPDPAERDPVYILGISAYFHDSSATLLRDGEIVAAAQEERFTRKKGDAAFPRNAIDYCLDEAGVDISAIRLAVFYENPYLKLDRVMETWIRWAPSGMRPFRRAFPRWAGSRLWVAGDMAANLGNGFAGDICHTGHHLSHAASAFFPSPFQEAAILTLDAVGEWSTSTIGAGRGNRVEILREIRFPHSLGMLYSAFTYYTGFKVNSGEYKLMGLAPYGEPRYVDTIREELLTVRDDGSIELDMKYFDYCAGMTMTSPAFHQLFGGPPKSPEETLTKRECDLAASIQKVTEEVILKSARQAHRLTGSENLVMAGGVALNCVANGRLLRHGPFRKIWVQPAAGDAGGSLGAALLAWHHFLDRPRVVERSDSQRGSFLGPAFKPERTRVYLDSVGAVFHHIPDETSLLAQVVDSMVLEKVVGWFHGRMEFGPRALGARSIIGDARSVSMQQTMNLKIKYRESFRPFAPCVLRERAHEIFEMEPGLDSPYMLFVAGVREEHRRALTPEETERMSSPDLRVRVSVPRSSLPAITHVDYSARVQTVDEERHGRFYRLMKAFEEETGCPVIVNTSFNIRGEPIVCSPENAYRCFMATEMDCLVIDDYLLIKEEQPAGLLPDISRYKESIALD